MSFNKDGAASYAVPRILSLHGRDGSRGALQEKMQQMLQCVLVRRVGSQTELGGLNPYKVSADLIAHRCTAKFLDSGLELQISRTGAMPLRYDFSIGLAF
ncbi:unnamed protein product [Enterobius vermicularis]|uniref:Uncharacterized protein n=1 Tax=Enterobius vermicularis TaxID=51028 RepID=A0A0N4VJM0_ENTVE|nr:unnamed protein product [Enterobius vermicularis]